MVSLSLKKLSISSASFFEDSLTKASYIDQHDASRDGRRTYSDDMLECETTTKAFGELVKSGVSACEQRMVSNGLTAT
jgi:hypothetical protein